VGILATMIMSLCALLVMIALLPLALAKNWPSTPEWCLFNTGSNGEFYVSGKASSKAFTNDGSTNAVPALAKYGSSLAIFCTTNPCNAGFYLGFGSCSKYSQNYGFSGLGCGTYKWISWGQGETFKFTSNLGSAILFKQTTTGYVFTPNLKWLGLSRYGAATNELYWLVLESSTKGATKFYVENSVCYESQVGRMLSDQTPQNFTTES